MSTKKFADQNIEENKVTEGQQGDETIDETIDEAKPAKPPKEPKVLSEVGQKISASQSGIPKPTITITCNGQEYTNLTQALYANELVNQEAYKNDPEVKKAGDKLWSQVRNALKRAGEYTLSVPNADDSLPATEYVFKAVNQDWVAPQPTEEELAEKQRIKEEKAAARAAKAAAKAAQASHDESEHDEGNLEEEQA